MLPLNAGEPSEFPRNSATVSVGRRRFRSLPAGAVPAVSGRTTPESTALHSQGCDDDNCGHRHHSGSTDRGTYRRHHRNRTDCARDRSTLFGCSLLCSDDVDRFLHCTYT